MAADHAAFVEQYKAELKDLTFNSKAIINTLTMLASEFKTSGSGIAEAIEDHIRQCPPQLKLPALFLLDSIVKNVGLPYTALFARDVPEIYTIVWKSAPQSRPSLQRLLGTWQKVLPQDVLIRIGQLLAEAQRIPAAVSQPSSVQTTQTQMRPNAQQQYPQPQQYQVQNHRPPMQAVQHQYPVTQQLMTQHNQPGPQSGVLLSHGGNYGHYPPQPMAVQPGFSSAQPMAHHALPPPPSPPQRNNYAAAYTPTYPQPQISAGLMPPDLSPNRAQAAVGYSQEVPNSQGSNTLPEFLSQLLNAGIIPQGGNPTGGVSQTSVSAPLSFSAIQSKDLAAAALQKLLAADETNRPKFLEQLVKKKRKVASGVSSSRQWYVKESDWLAGTTASAEAVPAFFDEPEQENDEDAEEEEASVTADPDQPTCAMSGEKFDSFWDDAKNEWRYQGAVALTEEQASRYGLNEGQLVKVSCLVPTVVPEPEPDSPADVSPSAIKQEAGEEAKVTSVEESAAPEEKGVVSDPNSKGIKNSGKELSAMQSKRIKIQ